MMTPIGLFSDTINYRTNAVSVPAARRAKRAFLVAVQNKTPEVQTIDTYIISGYLVFWEHFKRNSKGIFVLVQAAITNLIDEEELQ